MKHWARFFLFLLCCSLGLPFFGMTEEDTDCVRLYALNVGKADCLILQAEGKTYLIDTGYERTAARMLTALEQLQVKHLDGVFITHQHKDHVGGLDKLVHSDIAIDAFYAPAFSLEGTGAGHAAVIAAARCGQSVHFLKAGDVVQVSSSAAFSVLAPERYNDDNENNNSLVMCFTSAHGSILLTGDMKNEEEYLLLKSGRLTACNVLKVAFHGDDTSTSSSFLKIVKPRIGIISTSTEEEADTPSSDVLRRLALVGCETHITQESEYGVCVTLKDGRPTAAAIEWALPDKITALSMKIDLSDDLLLIENNGEETVFFGGMTLFSTRGEEFFEMPEELSIAPEQTVRIASSKSRHSADAVLKSGKRIWHKSRYDAAILYDSYGREIARTDNGMPQ